MSLVKLEKKLRILFPLEKAPPFWRYCLALAPTILALAARPYFPPILETIPGALYCPLVLVATCLGGWISGVLSTFLCLIFGTLLIRSHLLLDPLSDLPGLLRTISFVTACLSFVGLIGVLQKTLRQVLQSLRLRDEFLSLVSHELRTPLTSLRYLTEISKNSLEDQKVLFSRVELHVGEMEKLINSMFDSAYIETEKFSLSRSEFNLVDLAHNVKDSLIPKAQAKKVSLSVVADTPVLGKWDQTRIEQVVANLINNALQYAPGSPVEIRVAREEDFAVLSVKDQGKGMSQELQQKIFGKFERGVSFSEVQGLGLGLYISHAIASEHGGKIQVKSLENRGSTFSVYLPLAAGEI